MKNDTRSVHCLLRMVSIFSLVLMSPRIAGAARPNPEAPTVEFLFPSDASLVTGTVDISAEACSVPQSDTIVSMQVRFIPQGAPATAWRNMSFSESLGCVAGLYEWDTSEFNDGSIVVELRAADFDGKKTKWSTGITITVIINSGGGSTLVGTRHLFVWDSSIPGDLAKTDGLLAFAEEKRIDVVYIDVAPLGTLDPNAPLNYLSFLTTLHAAGLDVYALSGNPSWGIACGASLPGQDSCLDDGWNFYENVMDAGLPFDGLVDNTEPYNVATDDWWNNLDTRAQQYLDFLHGVRDVVGGMPLVATIPFWYDQDPNTSCLKLDGRKGPCKPLNWYVGGVVDDCAIMDYRDVADGPNGMIAHAMGELDTHSAIIGVETQDLGVSNDILTFFEEGEDSMEIELTKVYNAFNESPNFSGFFIHYYGSYFNMAP